MAKNNSTAATRGEIEVQRRKAQAAIDRNRVGTGRKARSLTPRERAAYQRIVKRTDKLLGPVPKPRSDGVSGLQQGLRILKNFAERIRASSEEGKKIPGKMP